MTKKDYIKIADLLKENKRLFAPSTYKTFINRFADMLELDNPSFNRETFINYTNK